MALHPRLQQPTLEAPPKRGHGIVVAMALTVLAAGFAYAMPRAMSTSATEDPADVTALTPTGSTHTPTATATPTPSPTATPTEAPDDGDEGEGRKANHGAAVSTAARCDLKGRAHGELVRTIAQDKDATVAEAEAACEAARAAAAATGAADVTDDKVRPDRGRGKPDKAKLDDDEDAVEIDDTDDEPEPGPKPEETVPDEDAGGQGPPDHAKGNKNKP